MDLLEASDAKPPRTTVFWIVVSVLFFSFSWLSSAFASYGSWKFGAARIEFWWIWDPGGAYLSNGINLFETNIRDLGFKGHPGLPLTVMIAVISRLYYWFSGARGHSIPYSLFAAKHLQSIILFSRLAITGFHLLSFYVLFRFSVGLLKSRRASMIAVLGYATSLFVLIFINDISAEPFLLIFTLLALIWSRRIPELLSSGMKREAYLRAALAGLVCVFAFYTKFMLAAPLLIFIPIFILGARHHSDQGGWENLKRRMPSLVIFSSSFLLVFALGTVLVNWRQVIKFWMEWAPGRPQLTTSGPLANAWHLLVVSLPALASTILDLKPGLPGINQQGIFTILESGFMLLSIIGLAIYWKAHKPERAYLGWLIGLILLFVPILTHRGAWHYLVIHLAIAAVFFGYLIDRLALKFTKRYPVFSNSFVVAICFVLLVHSGSITLSAMIKWSDIVKARRWTPYFAALQQVSYDGHIGLIGKTEDLNEVSGTVTVYAMGTPLDQAFRQFFVQVDRETSSEDLAARKIQIILEKDQNGNVKVRPIQQANSRSIPEFKPIPTRGTKTDRKVFQGAEF